MEFLVAVDGSEEAENALAYASEIADAVGGSITVVHAVDPTVYEQGGSEPISTLTDADQRLIIESIEDAERRALDIIEEMTESGGDVDSELVYGDPDTAIADYADREEFDAIYVGHRGRSERTESMIGSVAKAVVERATIPVTVVR